MKPVIADLISCLMLGFLIIAGFANAQNSVLIQSDLKGETLSGNQKSYSVEPDRYREFPYSGVLGIWNSNIDNAPDGERVQLTEKFTLRCSTDLKIYAMIDDSFTAYINDVEVLKGSNWEELYQKTISVADFSTYKITLCGENTLLIKARNDNYAASIAYQLVTDSSCAQCNSPLNFDMGACMCTSAQYLAEKYRSMNYMPNSIIILDRSLNWANNIQLDLNSVNLPDGAQQLTMVGSMAIETFGGNGLVRVDIVDRSSGQDVVLYPFLGRRYGDAVSKKYFDIQNTFTIPVPQNKKLTFKLNGIVSAASRIVLEIVGYRV